MTACLTVPMSVNFSAMASEYKITVNPPSGMTNQTYNAYRIFDLSYNADKTAYTYTIAHSDAFTEAQIFYECFIEKDE